MGVRSKSILMFIICVYMVLSAAGPTMNTTTIWVFAVVHGLLIGAVQSYSRSLFAQLVPVGYEAQFFALFEITDKGSSWMGPTILAIVSNMGYTKYAWFYITFINIIALPILYSVDVEK